SDGHDRLRAAAFLAGAFFLAGDFLAADRLAGAAPLAATASRRAASSSEARSGSMSSRRAPLPVGAIVSPSAADTPHLPSRARTPGRCWGGPPGAAPAGVGATPPGGGRAPLCPAPPAGTPSAARRSAPRRRA